MGIFESEQERSSEGGFSLLEVMLALPVELILCLAMLGIFNLFVHSYATIFSGWELVQQIRIPIDGMAYDVRYGEELIVTSNSLRVSCQSVGGADKWVEYRYVQEDNGNLKLMRNSQPLYGDTDWVPMRVYRCSMDKMNPYKVRVVLGVRNLLTSQEYEIDTVLYSIPCYLKYRQEQQASMQVHIPEEAAG